MNLVRKVVKEIKDLPWRLILESLGFIKFLKYKTHIKNIPETMLLSEKSLAEDWLASDEDEIWEVL